MSEDIGYGDCRDSCVQFAIASEFACMDCGRHDEPNFSDEQDFFPEMYDPGG